MPEKTVTTTKLTIPNNIYCHVVELTRVRDAIMCLQQTASQSDKVSDAKRMLFQREDELCRMME